MDARQYIINEAIQEQRQIFGMENPHRQWILTSWDTWETNPFYCGPEQQHPEDDTPHEIWLAGQQERSQLPPPPAEIYIDEDDEIPF